MALCHLPGKGREEVFPRKHVHDPRPGCTLQLSRGRVTGTAGLSRALKAQQPELRHTRNHCQGCLTLVSYLVLLSVMYFLLPTKVQHSTAPEQPSPGKLRPNLPAGFTAGMEAESSLQGTEEILSRGPSSKGFSFTSEISSKALTKSPLLQHQSQRKSVAVLLLGIEELWSTRSLALIKPQWHWDRKHYPRVLSWNCCCFFTHKTDAWRGKTKERRKGRHCPVLVHCSVSLSTQPASIRCEGTDFLGETGFQVQKQSPTSLNARSHQSPVGNHFSDQPNRCCHLGLGEQPPLPSSNLTGAALPSLP